MSERIFLTYTNASAIPYQGSVLGHHIVLNYIDSDGEHYTLQGMPEHKFDRNAAKLIAFIQEEGWPGGGANNADSPFQRLRAEQKASKASDPSISLPSTLIAEGDDLRSRWERMTSFGDEVNSKGYEYRPYSQNSNSFAAGALKRAGFLGPGTVLPRDFRSLVCRRSRKRPNAPGEGSGFRSALGKSTRQDGSTFARAGYAARPGEC
ncbi:MAG: hypothetical protein H0V72_11600 [Bradyrhizobium sp.]|nr:hypothetical protein [Bradyrhizobium sp.]